MTIAESQLDTWSHQGSVSQSAATYQTVRGVLERADAPYRSRSYAIFLQGSYANDTNIYADSDVDVVIRLDSVYYSDTSELSEAEQAAYKRDFSPAQYSWTQFRQEVIDHLSAIYGSAVQTGKKAIFIASSGNRRDTDVLPAAEFRRYFRYASATDRSFADGICFWLPDGTRIVNYPKQHSANCTAKHQQTNSWFKPTVRILKNMRNIMTARGELAEGAAPSYFIEGMLYSVPNDKFGSSYGESIVNALNWLHACDRDALVCANRLYKLLHPTSPVTWRRDAFETYLRAVIDFWNKGG